MALTDLHSTTSAFISVFINDNCIMIIPHYYTLKLNTVRNMYTVLMLTAELIHDGGKKIEGLLTGL